MRDIYIDCYDERIVNYDFINIGTSKGNYNYIFNSRLKLQFSFTYALFVDEQTLNNHVYRYPRKRRFALLQETPNNFVFNNLEIVESRFDFIYTHNKNAIIRSDKYKKLLYGTSWVYTGDLICNKKHIKTSLISFVGSIEHGDAPGYNFRKNVVKFLSIEHKRADLLGKGLKPFKDKESALSKYCFAIVMENCTQDYYFSEKLIDCFMTLTIPIYWGSKSIDDVFDSRGIIHFDTIGDLDIILNSLSFSKYHEMVKYLEINRNLSIKKKLNSPKGMYKRMTDYIEKNEHLNPMIKSLSSKAFAGLRKYTGK